MRLRLDDCARITLVAVLCAAGAGCTARAQPAPMARGWHGMNASLATDAPALRRAARDQVVRDAVPWYAARRDREPAVVASSRDRTNERSVTTTYDSQFLSSTTVRDQIRSRTVSVRRTSSTY